MASTGVPTSTRPSVHPMRANASTSNHERKSNQTSILLLATLAVVGFSLSIGLCVKYRRYCLTRARKKFSYKDASGQEMTHLTNDADDDY